MEYPTPSAIDFSFLCLFPPSQLSVPRYTITAFLGDVHEIIILVFL